MQHLCYVRSVKTYEEVEMIRFRLKELIAQKEFEGRCRITLEQVSKATGIHRTTLSRLANQTGYNTTLDVVDKLCLYFGVKDVNELMQFVAEAQ